jgi:hypothetical protein
LLRVGIPRIPKAVAEVVKAGPPEPVGSGLGENLDAAIAKPVVFGRERILIDPDFTDRILGGHLAAAKPIDVNRAAVGAGRRTRQRLQVRLKVLGTVGQGLQVSTVDRQRAGIAGPLRRDPRPGALLHGHVLDSCSHPQLEVQSAPPGFKRDLHGLWECQVRSGRLDGIVAGDQSRERVAAVASAGGRSLRTG